MALCVFYVNNIPVITECYTLYLNFRAVLVSFVNLNLLLALLDEQL